MLKDIFKRNFVAIARSKKISSGTALSKLAAENKKQIEKTYCNSLLKEDSNPINLSLDKLEAISSALNVPAYQMLNPSFNYDTTIQAEFDLAALANSIKLARLIAKKEGIDNVDFECSLASFLFFADEHDMPEAERYTEVFRLTRKFTKL